jgi:hypothetical protein
VIDYYSDENDGIKAEAKTKINTITERAKGKERVPAVIEDTVR